jgi:hypothetical protein
MLGSTRQASGGIVDYSGVNTTAPVDASASAAGAGGNAVAASVTTSAANDRVILASGFNITTTVTAPSGATGRYAVTSPSSTDEAADFVQASAGTTPAHTATPANASSPWIAHTIALRDAAQAALSVSTTAAPTCSANLDGAIKRPRTLARSSSDLRSAARGRRRRPTDRLPAATRDSLQVTSGAAGSSPTVAGSEGSSASRGGSASGAEGSGDCPGRRSASARHRSFREIWR